MDEERVKSLYECRCDERLNTKVEESTRLTHTGLFGGTGLLFIMNQESES